MGGKGVGDVAATWGCALSAVAGIPLLGGILLFAALEECGGGIACRHGVNPRVIALAVLVALGIGVGTRLLVNATFRSLRELGPGDRPDRD